MKLTEGRSVKVQHILDLTMVDWKVHSELSDATDSTQCCSICGASPKHMNDLVYLKGLQAFPQTLDYGLYSPFLDPLF